jgi:hypothetical protein
MTWTIEWLHCKLQTHPLVGEGAPQKRDHNFQTATFQQEVISGRKSHKGAWHQNILTDWLTVSHKVTSTLTSTLTWVVQRLTLSFSKGPNRVGVFLPIPEHRTKSCLWNVVFSSYIEFWWWQKSTNPVILSSVHHPQNPLDSSSSVVPHIFIISRLCKLSLYNSNVSLFFIKYISLILFHKTLHEYPILCQNFNKSTGIAFFHTALVSYHSIFFYFLQIYNLLYEDFFCNLQKWMIWNEVTKVESQVLTSQSLNFSLHCH